MLNIVQYIADENGHVFVMKHRKIITFLTIFILTFAATCMVYSRYGSKSGVTYLQRCFRTGMFPCLTFSNIDPLTSQYYIVELGFYMGMQFFLFLLYKT